MKTIIEHPRSFAKLLFFVVFLFFIQILLCVSFVYRSSIQDIDTSLTNLSLRIEKDLKYSNGKWDTRLYNADPLTPYPNGSSGFINPLYIITNSGFIIERSQPIKGFLDTSDFRHLMQFQTPQTIDTITNEKWRIYSKPIINGEKAIGAIVVSYYNPPNISLESIDKKLKESIISIESALTIKNGIISTNRLDIRNIHYEFSFEVVDIFNNVLINNGRVPTFIDTSYFSKELQEKRARIVVDSKTNNQYYVVSLPVKSDSGEVVGLIIVGETILNIYRTIRYYVLFFLIVTVFIIIPLMIRMVFFFKRDFRVLLPEQDSHKLEVKKICFDKKASTIFLDSVAYSIPYASNQYYICDALFSHPTKKWEYDELLDKLGDDGDEPINTRKVYDAVLAINKKVGVKLFEYKHKIFSFNPNVLRLIVKM